MSRIRRHVRLLAFLPLVLAAACGRDAKDGWKGTIEKGPGGVTLVRNPERGAWREGEGWTAEEDLRIGIAEGTGPTLFGDVAAVEVDSAGRIWVLDRQAKELRVFDARGKYVRTVGREGGGPGEFRDPIGLAWAPDGTLWVADPAAGRYTVFDTAGIFIDSHPRLVAGYSLPWNGGFGPDGLLYEVATVMTAPGDSRNVLLRFDAAVEPLDTIRLSTHHGEQFELRRGERMMAAGVPFSPGQVMALSPGQVMALDPRGFLWMGVTDRYRLAQMPLGGDTVRIVERQAAPVPVTAAERAGALARMKWFTDQGGRIDAGRIPAHKPAYEQVIVDPDGGIWVRPALPAGYAGAAFDVFDGEGRYQGRLAVPGGMDAYPTPVIRGGALYGVARDSLDVPQVVRVRIQGGDAKAERAGGLAAYIVPGAGGAARVEVRRLPTALR